jgi:hypothetical protein
MTTQEACLPCGSRGRARAATPGYRTCDSCSLDIRDDLAEIRDRYARLDVRPASSAGEGSSVRSVPRSKSPANDHVLSMMDPRSTTTGRAYAPPATLRGWVQLLEEETGQRVWDASVTAMVAYLSGLHAHITRQLWVDDYARELHELVQALRPVTGEPRPRPIGSCPTLVDDGQRECGTRLYAPLNGDTIRCRGCGREWVRAEWLRLGKVLEAS